MKARLVVAQVFHADGKTDGANSCFFAVLRTILIKFRITNVTCEYVSQQQNHFLFTLFLRVSVGFPTVGEPCFIYPVINKLYHCLCCLEV